MRLSMLARIEAKEAINARIRLHQKRAAKCTKPQQNQYRACQISALNEALAELQKEQS